MVQLDVRVEELIGHVHPSIVVGKFHIETLSIARSPSIKCWHEYDIWQWVHNRNVVQRGVGFKTSWPSAERIALNRRCSGEERERASRRTQYTVIFDDLGEKRKYRYNVDSFETYRSYPMGAKYIAMVNSITITSIKKASPL